MVTDDIEKRITENLILETGNFNPQLNLNGFSYYNSYDNENILREAFSICVDCTGKILSMNITDSSLFTPPESGLKGISIYELQDKNVFFKFLRKVLENTDSTKYYKLNNHPLYVTKQEFTPFHSHKSLFLVSAFYINRQPSGAVHTSNGTNSTNSAQTKQPVYYKEMFDNSPYAILLLDQNNKIVSCNKSFENLFKYKLEEIVNLTGEEILYTGTHETPDSMHTAGNEGKKIQKETIRKRKDGSIVNVFMQGNILHIDDKFKGRYIVYTDISSRKRSEEQIISSLLEKEVLLKEIHHRVKNNLQIISSLLNFQSAYIKDTEAIEMFKESQNRVKSIALLHEKLYQASDLSRVDYANYLRSLITYIFNSAGLKRDKILFNIKAENIFLSIDNAIPCGLIINELVTNSIKYAFPGDMKGEIVVQIQYNQNNKFTLIVKDNGIGFPPDKDFRKTDSLGLKLVMILINQMSATIELDNRNGTEFKIEFSILNYKDRM